MQTSSRSRSHANTTATVLVEPKPAGLTTGKGNARTSTGGRGRGGVDMSGAWENWWEDPSRENLSVLVSHYMASHVQRIAERLSARLPDQVDIDDLIQEGYIGLVECIKRYDPSRNTKFETFSSARINGAMRDYLRRLDNVPRLVRSRERSLQRVVEAFRKDSGRLPSEEEVRSGMDLDQPRFRKFMNSGRAPSLVQFSHASRGDDGDGGEDSDGMGALADTRSQYGGSPRARAEHEDLRRWLASGFSRRDQLIITLYYYERMTMKEVGEVLGICESRVSQRLEVILNGLRARLQDTGAESEFEFRD